MEVLRSLLRGIVLTSEVGGDLALELGGDLAGIQGVATSGVLPVRRGHKAKPPAVGRGLALQVEMDAGTGFEPVTFRL